MATPFGHSPRHVTQPLPQPLSYTSVAAAMPLDFSDGEPRPKCQLDAGDPPPCSINEIHPPTPSHAQKHSGYAACAPRPSWEASLIPWRTPVSSSPSRPVFLHDKHVEVPGPPRWSGAVRSPRPMSPIDHCRAEGRSPTCHGSPDGLHQ